MPSGYVRVWAPGHPVANRDGYVLEHRRVAFDAGLELPAGHHVHHRNGDKTDNRLENLEVKPASEHVRDHTREQGFVENQFGVFPLVEPRSCLRCGLRFQPTSGRGRYCSRACANRRNSPVG